MELRNVVLTGPRGAGKTTLLPLLAAKLELSPMSFDEILLREVCSYSKIEEFLQSSGATNFLECEGPKLLANILRNSSGLLLELGAGALAGRFNCCTENRLTVETFSSPVILLPYPLLSKSISVLEKRLRARNSVFDNRKTISVSFQSCRFLASRARYHVFFQRDRDPLETANDLGRELQGYWSSIKHFSRSSFSFY